MLFAFLLIQKHRNSHLLSIIVMSFFLLVLTLHISLTEKVGGVSVSEIEKKTRAIHWSSASRSSSATPAFGQISRKTIWQRQDTRLTHTFVHTSLERNKT